MGREIELKLTIDRADIDGLIRHPLISRYLSGPITRKRLVNRYYDTPDNMLRHHHMALRVRWNGKAYIQTLKRKGHGRNGLTDREEWEWPLEGPGLNTALAPMDFWPTDIQSRLDTLIPLFETNFERTLWPLSIPAESFPGIRMPAKIEMALDQGEIRAVAGKCDSKVEILEVELELLEGDSNILHLIREELAEDVRLTPGDMSKADRGYRLLAGHK